MRTKTLRISKKDAVNGIKSVANILELELIEQKSDSFVFSKKAGLLSYGNILTIKISTIEKSKQKISITSVSLSKIQLIDWGTNSDLEEEFIDLLKDL